MKKLFGKFCKCKEIDEHMQCMTDVFETRIKMFVKNIQTVLKKPVQVVERQSNGGPRMDYRFTAD